MKAFTRSLLVALCLATQAAGAMDVAEAYAAIPHRRTAYDPAASPSPLEQKSALAWLFARTDRGVVLRVEGMKAHGRKDPATLQRVVSQYDALIGELAKEEVIVPEVAAARSLVVEALKKQRRYLQSQPAGQLAFVQLGRVPEVSGASQQLLEAYGLLMKTYPKETPRNRTSFFDHLCALDFL
jgi:hypothetical protein